LEIRASITSPELGKKDSTDCYDDSPDVIDSDNRVDRPQGDSERCARVQTRLWCDELNTPQRMS